MVACMYASPQARNLALEFAEALGMSVDEFFANAPKYEDQGIGPGSLRGWRARDVRALNTAIRSSGWLVRITAWMADFGRYASRIVRWRPSWPSRVPRPSRQTLRRSGMRIADWFNGEGDEDRARRRQGATVIGALVVFLILLALVVSPATTPQQETAAEVATELTVVASVPVTPTVVAAATVEPTVEPTAVPVAPEEVTVVGRVKETVDKVVYGAEVFVGESSSRTDKEGIFRVLDVLKAEEYTLDIVSEGILRRITRAGGRFLSGPGTDDVGEFLLGSAEEVKVEAETVTTAQTETEAEAHIVTVKSGDTVWDLLEEELGQAPTWEQIKSVVDANDLNDQGVNEAGLWIVLIQIDQTIDLSAGLAVG